MTSPFGKRTSRGALRISALSAVALLATSCVGGSSTRFSKDNDYGYYKVGRPYKIKGITYYPGIQENYDQTGIASWYGTDFHGKKTANGDIYDMEAMTAAHKTLPLPSIVQVTNMQNGKKIIVMVNDRGPFAAGRIIDLSRKAADELDFQNKGLAKVRVQYLKRATDDFLSRMSGGKPRKESSRLTLSSVYGSEAGLHGTGREVVERTSYSSPVYGYDNYDAPWNKPNRSNVARRGVHRASAVKSAARNNIPVSPLTVDSGAVDYVPTGIPHISFNSPITYHTDDRYVAPAPTATHHASAAPAGGGYYVQAATYSVATNAAKAERHLRQLSDVHVQRQADGYNVARKVFVGPARSQAEAEGLRRDVIAHGYPGAKIVSGNSVFTN